MNRKNKQDPTASTLLFIPILPGKVEAWRRFAQEIQEVRQDEWAQWRSRAGLANLQVWLAAPTAAAVQVDGYGENGGLFDENEPFDRWLREQVLYLHGLDLRSINLDRPWELILDASVE